MLCLSTADAQRIPAEGQAIIAETEARLIFPVTWTRALLSSPPGNSTDAPLVFLWSVSWPAQYIVDGRDPEALWLSIDLKPRTGPRASLSQLIAREPLEAMINCTTCDLAVFADPERDSAAVFATLENGRLVFHVRGRKAIQRIFPRIPDRVTFGQIRQSKAPEGYPQQLNSEQTILVNCPAQTSGARRRSCLVIPPVIKRPPNADSAAAENAPRLLGVSVVTFSDAMVIPGVDVAIRTPDNKVWKVVTTTKDAYFIVRQPPLGHLMLVALCKQGASRKRAAFGTLVLEMNPRLDTLVTLRADPRLC